MSTLDDTLSNARGPADSVTWRTEAFREMVLRYFCMYFDIRSKVGFRTKGSRIQPSNLTCLVSRLPASLLLRFLICWLLSLSLSLDPVIQRLYQEQQQTASLSAEQLQEEQRAAQTARKEHAVVSIELLILKEKHSKLEADVHKMFNYISFCFYYVVYRVIKLIMWITITSLPTVLVEDFVCKLFARKWIKISNGESQKGKGLYDEKLLTQEIVVHNSKFYKRICYDQVMAFGVSCLRN